MGGLGSDLRPGRDPRLPVLRLLAVEEVGPRRGAPAGPRCPGMGKLLLPVSGFLTAWENEHQVNWRFYILSAASVVPLSSDL